VFAGTKLPGPAYFPACTHFLHLGFVGVVANARYAEMLDLILGFIGVDLACDDGRSVGRWIWE
jgi:hypothetical protein